MTILKTLCLIFLATTLASCAYFMPSTYSSRNKAYINATSVPPLRMPAGSKSDPFETTYPVANRSYSGQTDVSLLPPDLSN